MGAANHWTQPSPFYFHRPTLAPLRHAVPTEKAKLHSHSERLRAYLWRRNGSTAAMGRRIPRAGAFARRTEYWSCRDLNRDAFLSVFWDGEGAGTDQRAYQDHDLEMLEVTGSRYAVGFRGSPVGSIAELLRTLGQELDRDQADWSRVAENEEGFEVSGVMDGKYFRRFYTRQELAALSAERRAARPTGTELLKRVSKGAEISTKDNQRIGKLKDVRGSFFQIGTSFMQRDYWLPGDCIASVGPGERVILWVTKAQADVRKSEGDPPQT